MSDNYTSQMEKLTSLLRSNHTGVRQAQVLCHFLFLAALFILPPRSLIFGGLLGVVIFNLGHSIGAHRYFAHRQFEADVVGRILLNIFFVLNMWGSSVGYAGVHILHHINSDKQLDPHSPKHTGIFSLWANQKSVRMHLPTFKSLWKDPINRFFHNYYFAIHIFWLCLLAVVSWKLIFVAWVIPVVVCYHLGKVQTVLAHVPSWFSSQKFATGDESQNIYLMKPFLWGDELHNNHHYRPSLPNLNFSKTVWEWDPNYWLILAFFRARPKHRYDTLGKPQIPINLSDL